MVNCKFGPIGCEYPKCDCDSPTPADLLKANSYRAEQFCPEVVVVNLETALSILSQYNTEAKPKRWQSLLERTLHQAHAIINPPKEQP